MLDAAMTTATASPAKRADARPYRQVNVRLPEALFLELDEAARLDHRSLSSAIAVAVARWARTVRAQPHGDERAG
jgi:hypothetical protein